MRGKWIVAGAVAVVVAGGVGAWTLMRGSDGPSAPPDGPWPMAASVQVSLCDKDGLLPDCEGKPVATRAQGEAVLRALQAMPGITQARLGSVYVRASLASRDTFPQVKAAISGMPGVGGVTGSAVGYWAGKSDLGITLCPAKTGIPGPCAGRGAATQAEKDAVYAELRRLPEVDVVYLADREFVAKVARHNGRGGLTGGWELEAANPPEQFHVRLAGTTAVEDSQAFAARQAIADRIRARVKRLPGVWDARWGVL